MNFQFPSRSFYSGVSIPEFIFTVLTIRPLIGWIQLWLRLRFPLPASCLCRQHVCSLPLNMGTSMPFCLGLAIALEKLACFSHCLWFCNFCLDLCKFLPTLMFNNLIGWDVCLCWDFSSKFPWNTLCSFCLFCFIFGRFIHFFFFDPENTSCILYLWTHILFHLLGFLLSNTNYS